VKIARRLREIWGETLGVMLRQAAVMLWLRHSDVLILRRDSIPPAADFIHTFGVISHKRLAIFTIL
jgi:hypothetical protein